MGFFQRFARLDFVRNVGTLLGGNVVAQLIAVGAAPILTRLFSPEEFGLFALYVAIASVVIKIGSLCYERAILLPAAIADAVALLVVSCAILALIVVCLGFVMLVAGDRVSVFLGNPTLADWALFIPLSVAMASAVNIIQYWQLRHERFKLIAASRVTEATVAAATKISIGAFLGAWSGGLIVGALTGSAVALVLLVLSLRQTAWEREVLSEARMRLKPVVRQYRQFPLFASWTALLSILSIQMVVFFFSAFFGAAVVGFYNLAYRMLAQPIATLANSVSRAYFQKSAVQISNRQQLMPGLRKTLAVLFLIGALPFSVLGMFGQEIFAIVFGSRWESAGGYAQIMTPWFFLTFLVAPAGIIFEVCQQQRVKLVLNALTAALIAATMIILHRLGQSVTAIIVGLTAINVVASVLQIVFAARIASRHDRGLMTT